jgi:hypothetical protein
MVKNEIAFSDLQKEDARNVLNQYFPEERALWDILESEVDLKQAIRESMRRYLIDAETQVFRLT